MNAHKPVLAALLLVGAACAQAQTTASSDGAAADDSAAMERARREADGPRRRILEAARLAAAPKPVDVPPTAPPRPSAEARLRTLQEPDAQPLAPAPTALESTTTPLPAVVLPPPAPALAALQPAVLLPPPRLLSKVDPDLPAAMFRAGARRTEVVVDLKINADGSVADARVLRSPDPGIDAAVVDALRQWRYEAQPVARTVGVTLVIGPG